MKEFWLVVNARKVARHEMVLPMDQNGSFLVNGKATDFRQHRVNQGEGLTKLTAGDHVHNRVKSAGEVTAHGWSLHGQHADPAVDGMIVSGLLKCEKRHVRV